MFSWSSPLAQLIAHQPHQGVVTWIGLRPRRGAEMDVVSAVMATAGRGLNGDRSDGGARQVTLAQAEHLAVIAALCRHAVEPQALRRNLLVAGINLTSLKGRRIQIGEAVVLVTGACQPCSRMETTLGDGGYNIMRGHGGITGRIVQDGWIRIDDAVSVLADS